MSRKTLLILGNGFDLKCGLKTKYIDFWNYQRKNNVFFDRFVRFLISNNFKSFGKEEHDTSKIIIFEPSITFFDIFFHFI